jgi:hypothetical protein
MDDIIERIEQGLTTADDARAVSRIIARLEGYELALREISLYGKGEDAMRAMRALVETSDDQAA